MFFGNFDSNVEPEQMSTRSKIHKPELKRMRSSAKADYAELQGPRKCSKLNTTARSLVKNWSISSTKLSGPKQPPKPSSPPPYDADNDSLRIRQLHCPQTYQNRASQLSEYMLPRSSISEDTPLDHRLAFIEFYHASEELYIQTFQNFLDLPFFPALHLQLLRSTQMKNEELAVCFDLISKTSQQDYKRSSRGWHPTDKMVEMQDKEMLYLLVRQADGYIGVDKVSEQESSSKHARSILGFLSFKVEPEDEEFQKMRPVLYIYEIHLDDRLRGQSLGGRMIRWAESQARLVKVTKVMLTVFTANEGARRMYEREGFVKDEASPEDRITRRKVIKADYIIMSKELE